MPNDDIFPHQQQAIDWLLDLDEEIDFAALKGKPRTTPDFKALYVITPTGRMHYDFIKSRDGGKTTSFVATAKWGETDTDPLADIQEMMDRFKGVQRVKVTKDSDLSEIELRVLAAMCLDGEVLIDLDSSSGMIVGPGAAEALGLFPKTIAAEKPEKSYLDHDPTKRHKRRKRR